MTTRKLAGAAIVAATLAGCATPGPLHVYSLPAAGEERVINDAGGETPAETPSFLESEDQVVGFAYDPFTDHFFLRLAPGDQIRVVDRPARKIKREFDIARPELRTGGDLAVRPRDGHLFFLAAGGIIETSRLGKFVRAFELSGVGPAPVGVAYDAKTDHLLVLTAAGDRVIECDQQGARVREISLARPAAAGLGFDSDQRELYAPLRGRTGEVGVFDESGKLIRTTTATGPFVDVGPRSFVRVF